MDAKPKPDEQAHRPAPVIPPQPGAIAAAAAAAAAAAVAGGGTAASTTTPAAVAASAPTPTPAVPAGTTRTVGVSRDNLQRIAGINAEVERLLNVQGVTSYGQIANWSPNDVSRFDRLLGFEGRISRENWIEQARVLAGGGQTAYSRAMDRRMRDAAAPVPHQAPPAEQSHVEPAAPAPTPAPPPASRGDLSRLRSVRSEAYAGDDASARSEATGPGAARAADDLKRIRGVGVLIEKKLNSLGVSRYEQVANWTSADIERFSDKLDFKGRIERENWVEQARILAAGGQTEFSQRVDRGEV